MKPQSSTQADARAVATDPVLLRETIGTIAILTLNRPRTRNTLTEATLVALGEEFTAIAEDRGVRAVVLTAIGRPRRRG
jgi:enoyl-CoA hydratase/carnithine racemase